MEFFCSVFSRIWTEYGDLLRKSSHSVRVRENTDQKISKNADSFERKYSIFVKHFKKVIKKLFSKIIPGPSVW